MNDQQKRIAELEEQAAQDGFTLPMPAWQIVQIEDEGSMVDLQTGEISDEEPEPAPVEQKRWWQR